MSRRGSFDEKRYAKDYFEIIIKYLENHKEHKFNEKAFAFFEKDSKDFFRRI